MGLAAARRSGLSQRPAGLLPLAHREPERNPGLVQEEPSGQAGEAFQPLAVEAGVEFVVGMTGKFMTASQLEFRRFQPAEFPGFAEPGYGKVAAGFLVLPYGTSRSLLCTE